MANKKQEYAELAEAYKEKTGNYPQKEYPIEELRELVHGPQETETKEEEPKQELDNNKPLSSMTRPEVDEIAKGLGLDPSDYKNKDLVIAAIEEASTPIEDKKPTPKSNKKKDLVKVYDREQKKEIRVSPLTWSILKDQPRYEIRKTPKELQ